MNLKTSLISIFILSLILQCVSGIGLNCGTTAATGLCATCGTGFQADPSPANIRNCRKTIPKCSLWTPYLTKCVECQTSAGIKYSLFVEGQSCGIDNCAVPDGTNPGTQCTQCAIGYRLKTDKTQCIGRIPNCKLYNSHISCKQCNPMYEPTTAFDMCVPGTIRNCLLYRGPKLCLLCNDNFQPTPTSDMCNPGSINNCHRYYYPGKCQTCNIGYTPNLDQTRCVDKIPFCKTYDASTGLCTTCVDTYMQNAVDATNPLNTKCIPGTISQCRTYSANAVCQKCNDFFEPAVGSATCPVGTITDCISYNSNGVCGKCVDPKMPNAAVGGGAAAGSSCGSGSVLKCKSYSAINVCAVCQTGYTLTIAAGGATSCAIKIQNCKTFTSDTACAVCQNTFQPTLDFSKCLTGTLLGCDQYLTKAACKTCALGYNLNAATKTCSGRITNCKTYVSATVDPTTAPNGFVCSQCADTYKPDTNKLNCASAPAGDNCIRYTSQNLCAQCAKDNAQNAGTCGTPGTLITGCQFYGTTSQCRKCIDYKMPIITTGATCVDGSVSDCKVYSSTGVCQTCSVGFTLTINPTNQATTCVARILNCLIFSSNTVCTKCANIFQPSVDGSSCNAGTILNCQVYQSKGLCLTCQNGFLPNGAKTLCENAKANCKSYDAGNVCKQCMDNFNSDAMGDCVAAVAGENCLRYTYSASAIGTCNQCKLNHGFDATPACATITTPIASCQLYDTLTTCNKCTDPKMPVLADAGASILAKSACGPGSIVSCISYSGPGLCATCAFGFILNAGKTLCTPQIVQQCKIFTTSKSICSKCNDLFEPSLDFKLCNPGLIKNCRSYTSLGKCQICDNTFQPTTDFTKCLPGTIPHCQVYQATGLCKTCPVTLTIAGSLVALKVSADKKICQHVISNCAVYTDATTCSACGHGYYLTAVSGVNNKGCTAGTVLNCKIYAASANTCTTCNDQFYLTGNTCTSGTINGCLGYDTATKCNRCVDGKMPIAVNSGATPAILQGQSCATGNIDNCKQYSITRTCLSCNLGYTHTPGNSPICVAKIANCQVYQSQTQCRQCALTYQPSSDFTKCNVGSITDCNVYTSKSKCSICVNLKQPSIIGSSCVIGTIPKCLTYESRGKCGTCNLGYDVNSDKTQCIGKIPNCNTYTSAAAGPICAACQDTYQISTNSLTCTNPGQIPNCKQYSANNNCAVCADKHWKQSATSCKPGTIVDCLAYSAQLVCSKCIDGKMPDGTGVNCINGTITQCKSYSANAACGLCNPGYIPTASTGVACNGIIPFCKSYTSNTACKVCDNSYQPKIDFSQCISGSIQFCLTYSQKSKCSVCSDLYQPTLDFTKCNLGMIPNCKTYTSKGVCSACTAAYTVSTDKTKCLDTIPNCKDYNVADVKLCDLCQNTFELSTDKKSCPPGKIAGCSVYSANNVCDTCLQRYIKVSATQCKLGTIADCLAYSSNTVCSLCIDGKMPTAANNAVTPAIAAGSLCVAGTLDNCKTYSANAVCGVCILGFTVQAGGTCSPIITNCKAFNSLTSCKQCADNTMQSVNFGSCIAGNILNCVTYSSNSKCSVCQDYYQPNLDFSKCQTVPSVLPVPNCKTYAFRGKCSVCDIGYKVSADMINCQHTIPNCKTYAQDATTKVITCTQCQDTYEQDTTEKICLLGDNANCLTYSNINVCTKCVDKFYLASATTCTAGTIIDCLSYSSSTACTRCVQGKMPASNGATCIAGTLTGCKAYSGNLYCSACNPGYTLTTGTCIGKIANCNQYNSDTSCKLCNNNFQPTADTTQCLAGSLTGCKTYASKGVCTACNLGYTVSGSTCADTIANCKTYSVDGLTCTACKDTFEQDSTNKKCQVGNNANCLTYSAMNVCTKCLDKFYLATPTTCTTGTIVDCVVYNTISSCSRCIDNKMPSADKCVNGIISNCKTYSANAVCQTCHMGYTTVTPFTQCRSSIPNCMTYATQKLCKQCIDQFELSIDAMRCNKGSIAGCVVYEAYRKCAKCTVNLQPNLDKSRCISSIPNCEIYNTATTCKTCFATFEPSADFTKCNPGTIPNCHVYEAIAKCLDCKLGFTKSTDAKKCDPSIPYCQTYAVAGSVTCTTCSEGFFAQSNVKCVSGSIQRCRIYASATTCSLCEFGHQLTLDTTKCFKIIPNCRKYTPTLDKCQICLTGFQPNLVGHCRKIIPKCLNYNELTGLCQTCVTGYSLAFESTFCKDNSNLCSILGCSKCSQVDYCDTCLDGLQLSLDHKKCVKCSVLGCRMCDVQNSCALCQDGFTLTSVFENFMNVKKCYICSHDNCRSCDNAGACNSCDSGYTLASGNCVPCKFPCQTCDQTAPTKCTSCVSPAYFKTPTSTGGCILNTVSNCAVYDTVTLTLCTQCQPFFKLSTDKKLCERTCGANCKQCSGNTCTSCNTGFYLGNGFCYPCPRGCLQCTSASVCTKTASGSFFLSNNVPKPCPSFCKQCSSDGTCTTFEDNYNGFILVKNGNENVLASCQQGCQRCSPTNLEQCIICKPGYYLKTDNKCALCTERSCRTCDPFVPTKCLTCYRNTFKVSDICVPCAPNCLTCQDGSNPTLCTSCRLGFVLSGNACNPGLIQQCNQYSSANDCIKCSPGYTLIDVTISGTAKTICVPCVSNCRFCAKGQPSNCVDCGDNFYLNTENKCKACSQNCKKCTQTGCDQCNPGFRVNSAFTCSKNCVQPCATCSDSDPKICNSCILGYTQSGGSCQPQTTCTGGCKICAAGYTLNTGSCVVCKGQNCRTCDADKSTCKNCVRGFYLDTSFLCTSCPVQCETCISSTGCSQCATGYIAAKSMDKPDALSCIACQGNCATCIDTTKRCATCKTGFELNGWKCIKVSRIKFGLTLAATLDVFNGNYVNFLTSLGSTRSDTDFIQLNSIKLGSIILQGSIDPVYQTSSSEFGTELSTIQSGLLAGQTIGGMTIVSSSVTVSGYNPSASDQSNNLGLILGICIPVGILIIAIVVYVIYKKMTPQIKDGKLDDDTKMTSKHELQKNQFEMSDNILKNN